MSYTDLCGNCGSHRAECDCEYFAVIKSHTCKYCKYKCKIKTIDGYGSCDKFKLSQQLPYDPLTDGKIWKHV